MTNDPVQAAIAAAQNAAKALVEAQAQAANSNTTAVVPTTSHAVAPAGRPLAMEDMTGGLVVDKWLGVKEFGLLIGPEKALCAEPILVEIDMTAVQPNYSVKFGNPAQYFRTYDRVTEVRGGSWHDALRRAQAVDPRASEYRSVDLPMRLLQDVVVNKKVVAEAGETLGYSTSTTGWAPWRAFYSECVRQGLHRSRVRVQIAHLKRTNNKANVWGVVTYTLLGPAETAAAA